MFCANQVMSAYLRGRQQPRQQTGLSWRGPSTAGCSSSTRSPTWRKHSSLSSHLITMLCLILTFLEVGCAGPWTLFWALKKALKRAKTLKKVLSRANLLFWVLKKVLKRVGLLKKGLKWVVLLKRGLKWVGHSKKCSREGTLKRVKRSK